MTVPESASKPSDSVERQRNTPDIESPVLGVESNIKLAKVVRVNRTASVAKQTISQTFFLLISPHLFA